MDTQTKVKFIIGEPNYLIIELHINEENYSGYFLGEEIVSFSEHTPVKIQLLSDDPTAYMTVETYDEEEQVYIYPYEEEYVLSSGKDEENMIVPGYYEINIYIDGRMYYGFYKVNPSSVSWEGIMKIRDYLEKLMNGLAQNLYLRKIGKQGEYVSQEPSLLEIYEHIVNNERMLINNVDSLIKDPITNITKRYREQPYSRAPDMKSQRWLSKKGITVNSNAYLPEINYEKHCILDVDTIENRWIKKILTHTIEAIVELENVYKKILERINMNIKSKELEYNETFKKYEKVADGKLISNRYKFQLKQKCNNLKGEIQEYMEKISSVQSNLRKLKRIKATIAHYLYETWLREINNYEKVLKPSLRLIKEHRCYQLYIFYKKLLLMEKKRHGKKNSFPFKRTSLLFEYYTVAVVISILESLGYSWEKGWLADNIDPTIFNGELPKETEMIFRKDNVYLELIYDKEVSDEPDNPAKDQIVNINSIHTRPDIKLTAYDIETGKMLGCVIIEVKCSRSRYIYTKVGQTRAMTQIKDYINFGYYNADTKKYSPGGVSKVILVYPKQNPSISSNATKLNCCFVQIDPADEENGCKDLRKEIELSLNKFEELGLQNYSIRY